ncbi:MAG: hypothetical protein RLZZ480_314 [Candidatus Parcubacteria bacterium]|jgi:hypothetical protein
MLFEETAMLLTTFQKLSVTTVGPSEERHLLAHHTYNGEGFVSFIRREHTTEPCRILDLPDELTHTEANLREFLDMLQTQGIAGIMTPTTVHR